MKKVTLALFALLVIVVSIIFERCMFFEKNIYRYEQHKESLNVADSGEIFDKSLVTHLPIITIDTSGKTIPGKGIIGEGLRIVDYEKGDSGEEKVIADIKIYDNAEAQNNIKNKPVMTAKALVNVRGNSSRAFDKTNYKIEFVDEKNYELEKEYSIMGMPKGSSWALHAPFLDKTLIRNYMWMNISAKIMGYAPNVRFCECYVNDEYQGVFVMMETVEKSTNRVNISNYKKDSRNFSYMLKMDRLDDIKSVETFSSYTSHLDAGAGFTILYPKLKDLSGDVKATISKEISDFEKTLYSYDFKDPNIGYRKYIDVDSWVDFYIIQEFLVNTDMCSHSTYLYKNKGGKLVMGPVWDFNNVCDNYLASESKTEGFYFAENRIWYEMLMKDEYFVDKVIARYKELRKTYLDEEYLSNYIEETISYLGKSIERNYEVWGYTFERENQTELWQFLTPFERNPESYEEAVDDYKSFLIDRGNWLDENIESLKQYCHLSKIKLYVK